MLNVAGADAARRVCREIADQVDDYVLPRLARPDAPLLAVVGGSTGSGKSTLVNGLADRVVSSVGVLRPTTRSPVLICAAEDEPWFSDGRVLPSLPRALGEVPASGDDGVLHIVRCDTLPADLVVVDAPDFDSVVEPNRALAVELLGAADLWLFVTTAARYADAVPWSFLHQARDRGVAVAVVVDRCPEAGRQEVTEHFAQLLAAQGLGDAPFFVVPEIEPPAKTLPPDAIEALRGWLAHVARDEEVRTALVHDTVHGLLDSFDERLVPAIRVAEQQDDAARQLRAEVEEAFESARQGVDSATVDGSLVKGDVLARWRALVGGGELLDALRSGPGESLDRAEQLRQALADGAQAVVRAHAEQAVERLTARWSAAPAGAALLHDYPALRGTSEALAAQTSQRIADWQERVISLVRGTEVTDTTPGSRYDERLLGLILMLVAVLPVGAAAGTEVAVARSATRASRRLLEATFEGETVRQHTAAVRRDLQGEMHAVLECEAARYRELLGDQHLPRDSADQLREVLYDLQAVRQEPAAGPDPQ